MAKKRGGKNRKNKTVVDDPENADNIDVDVDNSDAEGVDSTTKSTTKAKKTSSTELMDTDGRDSYRAIADYVKGVQPLLDVMVKELPTPQAGKVVSMVASERNLLVRQVLKEFKKREAAIMNDQRGSKVIEKVLILLRQIIEEELIAPNSQIGTVPNGTPPTKDATPDPDASDDDDNGPDEFSVNDAMDAMKSLIRSLADNVYENCTNCYASHAIQTLLGFLPLFLHFELQQTAKKSEKSKSKKEKKLKEEDAPMTLADTVVYFFGVVRSAGIGHLMSHACGSHVVRSLFTAVNGYVMDKQAAPSGYKGKPASPLPSRQVSISEDFKSLFVGLIDAMLTAVSEEALEYATDSYANPVIQLVLHLLSAAGREGEELINSYVSLYLPHDQDSAVALKGRLDSLLNSPSGSRLVETCLSVASREHIHSIAWFYLKPEGHLNSIAVERYGNYFVQQILANKHLDAAALRCIAEELKIVPVIKARCGSVVWKLVDACRRVQDVYKLVATKLLEAFDVNSSAHFPLLWWSLICAKNAWELPLPLLKQVQTTKAQEVAEKREGKGDSKEKLVIDGVGCSIAAGLLKFPKEFLIPLLQAFKLFASPHCQEYLLLLAMDRQGSWLLQAMLDPYGPIDPKSQARLTRQFITHYSTLAFHPYASFVVSQAYKTAPVDVKRQIVDELKEKADALRTSNYALFRAIEFPKFLENDSAWAATETKKSKLKDLFSDILATPEAQSKPSKDKKDKKRKNQNEGQTFKKSKKR